MEELQSTEVLDREILEDARRKAQRILKAADETAASGTKKWERKTERDIKKARARYTLRLETSRNEIMARLPLDKRRIRLSKIEALLKDAVSSYLAGLPRPKLLAVLDKELKKRAGELDSPVWEGKASARGLSMEEAGLLLKQAFPQGKWTLDAGENRGSAPGAFPGLTVDTRTARITVSADAVMETLLRDKRAELAAALLGEGARDA
ncbi:MAG: V-type ATP synthase subunit E [Spirochaetaceae bacterium]|jgi:vacuolar-type H+-ATPase subunit E/Vma4|nr:V-type ATP synthase subunit E [Spirochaetaceae bacterium]